MIYRCCELQRRNLAAAHPTLNGIDWLEVIDRDLPLADPLRQRTLLALVVCGATTLSAFGCLALSQTPVLHAIGITVSLGTVLSFTLAAALSTSHLQKR